MQEEELQAYEPPMLVELGSFNEVTQTEYSGNVPDNCTCGWTTWMTLKS